MGIDFQSIYHKSVDCKMRIHEFTAAISSEYRLMESKSVLIRKKMKRVKMMKMLQFHSRCKRFTMKEDYVLLLKEIHFFSSSSDER